MHVAVTGASGLLGKALVASLREHGHQVSRLVRKPHARAADHAEIPWDPLAGLLDPAHLAGVDAFVHLAGENVGGGRWTDTRKAAIRDSRVLGTRTLVDAIGRMDTPPTALLSASAIGYYGDAAGDAPLAEAAPQGAGFLAEVCRDWEAEAQRAERFGVRVVRARLGVVLSPHGGALEKLLGPFKAGLGGKIGSGRQWMSWVALPDVVRALEHILATPTITGAVNVVADGAVTQAEFARTLARVLGRPSVLPLPGFAVKAIFGEMGESMLLGGQRVAPEALRASGFAFAHPTLEPALRSLLER